MSVDGARARTPAIQHWQRGEAEYSINGESILHLCPRNRRQSEISWLAGPLAAGICKESKTSFLLHLKSVAKPSDRDALIHMYLCRVAVCSHSHLSLRTTHMAVQSNGRVCYHVVEIARQISSVTLCARRNFTDPNRVQQQFHQTTGQ